MLKKYSNYYPNGYYGIDCGEAELLQEIPIDGKMEFINPYCEKICYEPAPNTEQRINDLLQNNPNEVMYYLGKLCERIYDRLQHERECRSTTDDKLQYELDELKQKKASSELLMKTINYYKKKNDELEQRIITLERIISNHKS